MMDCRYDDMRIRNLTALEVKTASDLADRIYPPSLYEPLDAFESKFRMFPDGVFGCFNGAELAAYVFSHPWTKYDWARSKS